MPGVFGCGVCSVRKATSFAGVGVRMCRLKSGGAGRAVVYSAVV